VIIDKLIKAAHILAMKVTFTSEELANLYIRKIVTLPGVPLT